MFSAEEGQKTSGSYKYKIRRPAKSLRIGSFLLFMLFLFKYAWVLYETPGKASGAYSSGGRGLTPLILLNYQGTLDDIFTLVHETGHSLHTHLASEAQPSRYAQYEMFVAEVASTTNECLLLRYLLDHAQDTAKRACTG